MEQEESTLSESTSLGTEDYEVDPLLLKNFEIDYTPKSLDNFKIVKFLGGGGYAIVYLGKRQHDKKFFALKILKRDNLTAFKKEAKILKALSHDKITKIEVIKDKLV